MGDAYKALEALGDLFLGGPEARKMRERAGDQARESRNQREQEQQRLQLAQRSSDRKVVASRARRSIVSAGQQGRAADILGIGRKLSGGTATRTGGI